MSGSWRKRKTRLNGLLLEHGDEDAKSLALDRLLHGQSVIGKTSKTKQIEELKFGDKDLAVLGTLEFGQYGVIDVVTCKLDGKAYIRKSTEKKFAVKTKDQCSPQSERDILLRALKSQTRWVPHLLCAFQSPTHLNLVMDYAEGGTLWDVLESSPHDGRVSESDMAWWAPQMISAIHWCHSQGFVHRDIKPHNFVITVDGRVMLIDFGSAAPLLPPNSDGSQQVPKRYCLVPCGTCDYISPEILQCHEEALVALEMTDNPEGLSAVSDHEPGGYGRETDWWSFGAMIYEMVYAIAPFFASDIRSTYLKIMDHQHSLRFSSKIQVSAELQDLLKRLLNTAELRIGRCSVDEVMGHVFFKGMKWDTLHNRSKPADLHLPQFTYMTPAAEQTEQVMMLHTEDTSDTRAFAFSALFQSSSASTSGPSMLHPTPFSSQKSNKSILREHSVASFIGFSWGPSIDAFPEQGADELDLHHQIAQTPQLIRQPFTPLTSKIATVGATPQRFPFMTPVRPSGMTPFQNLSRTGTVRRTVQRRAVSDREAMKQLVNCVGMSARKKVLESGRKPRILASGSRGSRSSTLKELRFDRSVMVVNEDGGGVSYRMDPTTTSESGFGTLSLGMSASLSGAHSVGAVDLFIPSDTDASMESSDAPPSPSPSPRPGSAMSLMSRRSQTPTTTSLNLLQPVHRSIPSTDCRGLMSPTSPVETIWTTSITQDARSCIDTGSSIVVGESLSYNVLDDLQKKHDKLMQDIFGLSRRLEEVSVKIGSRG